MSRITAVEFYWFLAQRNAIQSFFDSLIFKGDPLSRYLRLGDDVVAIKGAFSWDKTTEGHQYWDRIDDEYLQHIDAAAEPEQETAQPTSMDQQMQQALDRFKAIINHGEIVLGFEIIHDHNSDFTVPGYYAERIDELGIGRGSTATKAVNNLIKRLGITTVEQYIRIKEAS